MSILAGVALFVVGMFVGWMSCAWMTMGKVVDLEQSNAWLRSNVYCYYCGKMFAIGDKAANEYWKECRNHPVNAARPMPMPTREIVGG